MKVDVGRSHIEHGRKKCAKRCMIAAAIKEYDPTVTYVAVRTNCITVTRRRKSGGSVRQHWAVPTKAARAIIAFDMGEDVEPFSFDCKLIDEQRISQLTIEQTRINAQHTYKTRRRMKSEGIPFPTYGTRARVMGV